VTLTVRGLADTVSAVFGLPVIRRDPVEIVEDDLRRCRQRDTRSTRDDVGQEHANVIVVLKAVDQRLALRGRHLARQHDRLGSKGSGKRLQRLVEAREHDDLLPLLDGAANEVERRVDLGHGELLSRPRQKRQELRARPRVARV